MNGELEVGAMNHHHFGDSPFPLGKQCSCLCWKEVVTLRRMVTILNMKIDRHTIMIDEIKLSRQRNNTDLVEDDELKEDETNHNHHHDHQSPEVIPKNEIESGQGLEDYHYHDESSFDFNNMCETTIDTEEKGAVTLLGSSFIPSQPTASSSSSSSYLRIGRSSLQIVNLSSQMEDSGGGYDFIREDSDAVDSESSSDGMEPSEHPVFQNVPKKRRVNLKNGSVTISSTSTEGTIICQLCPNQPVFKTESNLKYHNRHFHTDVPEEFPCNLCGRKFPYRGGLTYHMKSVHQGRRFQCNENGCKNYYTTKSKLAKHQQKERHGSGYTLISLGETSSNYNT